MAFRSSTARSRRKHELCFYIKDIKRQSGCPARPNYHELEIADMHKRHDLSRVCEDFEMTVVDFSAFVERLAQVSGEVILPFFRSAIRAEDKSLGGVFDPVTEANRGAEAAMRRLIAQTFPAHGVIGEEYGVDRPRRNTSGFSIRSTGPRASFPACRPGAR